MTAEEVRNNSTVNTCADNGKMEVIKGAKVQVSHSSPPTLILEACLNANNEWQSPKSTKDYDLPTNENCPVPPVLPRFSLSPKLPKPNKLCSDPKSNPLTTIEEKVFGQNSEPNEQCDIERQDTTNWKGTGSENLSVITEHHGTANSSSRNSVGVNASERKSPNACASDVGKTNAKQHSTVIISTASETSVKSNHEHISVLNFYNESRNCIPISSSELMMKLMASDKPLNKEDKNEGFSAEKTMYMNMKEMHKDYAPVLSIDHNKQETELSSNILLGSIKTSNSKIATIELNNNIHDKHLSNLHFNIQDMQATTTSMPLCTQHQCSSEMSIANTITDSKPPKTPKITNPEILEQHISKIISENAAIVETLDPLWSKRYLRQSSSTAHSAESDGKKPNGSVRVRRFSEDLNATVSRVNSLLPQKSKLQSALLGKIDYSHANTDVPQVISTASSTVVTSMQVSATNTAALSSSASNLTSTSFCNIRDKIGVQTQPDIIEETSIVKNLLLVKPLPKSKPSDVRTHGDNMEKHPQNPEGSIIKDLLLKARTSSSSSLKDDSRTGGTDSCEVLRKHSREEISPLLYVCTVCKVAFRNKENLEVHQIHYCKGGRNSSVARKISVIEPMPPPFAKKVAVSTRACTPPWSSLSDKASHQSKGDVIPSAPSRTSTVVIETGNILKKHLTSPLNKLQGPPFKKRKISEPVISLNRPELSMFASTLDDFAESASKRSFDAVAVSPRKPHSVQMFGGEVQILDGAKPKTINIDAGLCTQNIIEQASTTTSGTITLLGNKTSTEVPSSSMSAVVVAIAKPVLNSGGTVMQVSTASMTHKSSMCLPVVALGQPIMATGAGVSDDAKTPKVSAPVLRSSVLAGQSLSLESKIYSSIPAHLSGADVLVSSSTSLTTKTSAALPSYLTEGLGAILPSFTWPSLDVVSIASADKLSRLPNSSTIGYASKTSTTGNAFPEIIKQIPSLPYIDSKTPSPTSKGPLLFSALGLSNTRASSSLASSSPGSTSCTDDSTSETKDDSQDSVSEKPKKFLAPVRPTSLPLKKKPFTLVGSTLVSPETPRPKKSCGQLYINGHAYTYLGLKCSTRSTYCCIYRPQPMYVPQDRDPKLSMYSNWQVVRAKEELGGLTPGKVIASYDSRQWLHGNSPVFGMACSSDLLSTHSSYWVFRQQELDKKNAQAKIADMQAGLSESEKAEERQQDQSENPVEPKLLVLSQPSSEELQDKQVGKKSDTSIPHEESSCDVKISSEASAGTTYPLSALTSDASNGVSDDKNMSDESAEETSDGTSDLSTPNAPKRVRIFEGGFKSNEDYTYVRGRGRGKYVCEECGIRCKKPSMLKKHIRTHTDLRPYSCKHCAFAFKTKGNLTKHMKSKAHHKKCVELGIIPVPKTIDDSQIDEEALAKQIERGRKQMSDGEDVDDEDDDDMDDEMDDSDCYDEGDDMDVTSYDEGLSGGEDHFSSAIQSPTKQVDQFEDAPPMSSHKEVIEQTVEKEQEAARSLLDLSTLANSSTWSSPITTTSASDIGKYVPNTMDQSLQDCTMPSSSRVVISPVSSVIKSSENSNSSFIEVVDTGEEESLVAANPRVPQSQYLIGSPRVLWVTSESSGHRQRSYSFDMPPLRTTIVNDKVQPQIHTQVPVSTEKSTILAAQLMSKDTAGRRYSMSAVENARQPTFVAPLPHWGRQTKDVQPIQTIENQLPPPQPPRERSQSFSIAEYMHRERIPQMEEKQNPSRERSQSFSVAERTRRWLETRDSDQAVGCSEQPMDLRVSRHRYEARDEHLVRASDISVLSSWRVNENLSLSSDYLPSGHYTAAESMPSAVASCPPDTYSSTSKSSSVANSPPEPPNVSTRYVLQEESLLGSFLQYGSSVAMAYRNAINKSRPELARDDPSTLNDQRSCSPPVLEPVEEHMSAEVADYHALSPVTPPTPEGKSSGFFSGDESSMGVPTPALPPMDPSACDNVEVSKNQCGFLLPTTMSNSSSMDEGRCTCSVCNKTFSKPSQLRLHLNIHYFERPFRCDSCSVSFRTKGHLQKHKRSVSHYNKVNMNITFGTPTTDNPRPFKCADCKIAFRIHGHLAKHLRSKMHIMKLECLGKLPFGMYAEMERSGVNLNEIDTTDCDNSLESLQIMAQRLYQRDPRRMRWHTPDNNSQHGSEDESMKPGTYVSPSSHNALTVNITESATQTGQSPIKSVGSNSLGSSPQSMLLHLSQTISPLTTPFLSPTSYNSAEVKQEPHMMHDPYSSHHVYSTNEIPVTVPASTPTPDTGPLIPLVPARTSPIPPIKEGLTKPETEGDSSAIATTRSSTCHICGRLFKSAKFLQVHLYCDHPGLVPTSGATPSNDFVNVGSATDQNKHEKSRQQWVAEVRPSSNHQDAALMNSVEGPPQTLMCELCGRQFSNSSSLQQHLLSHAQPRPFVCDICDAGFTSSALLATHLHSHQQEKAYMCHECGSTFAIAADFQHHLQIHLSDTS